MLNVANKGCIRRLGLRSMAAAKTRNIVAVLAIALTTVLFTSLFTTAVSLNTSYQQENFRQVGGDFHGTFKALTWEQVEDLRADPLIQESGARLMVGMPVEPPFSKSHVEVSYKEPANAAHSFCIPIEGAYPEEGTNQAATDTRVLALLGIEPEIGAEFTVTFNLDDLTAHPIPVTRTFTLCGWWEYDAANVASHILVPRSAAEELCALGSGDPNSLTGKWGLDVMLKDAMHIKEDLNAILEARSYQSEDHMADNYIGIGVNWGYTGAKFAQAMDAGAIMTIILLTLLIVFTGYLIIYNIFQISVTNDIRFYGLLKTIGTTGRQIKRIVRQQALLLSLIGIPFGLLLGFLIGTRMSSLILDRMDYGHFVVTFHPVIFAGAALFSLVTVFLSCARPGRMAAKVSPVEAVRCTEGGMQKNGKRPKLRRAQSGASLSRMAWANLGRSRGKTVVIVLSLTLAVVLATMTYTFASGFDLNKYLTRNADVDFILGDANYFNTSLMFRSADDALPEEIIAEVAEQGGAGITESGRTYGQVSNVQQFVPEDWYRQSVGAWNPPEIVEQSVKEAVRNDEGFLMDRAKIYGMEDFPLDLLTVVEGDISALYDPNQKAIAAVLIENDYSVPYMDSHWAKVGDTVTLRRVDKMEYYYTDNGEIIDDIDAVYDSQDPRHYASRPVEYEDQTFTVCALVLVRQTVNYRFYGADQYVLNAEVFKDFTGTDSVMHWCFNTTDELEPEMEAFLADYTENVQTLYNYESRTNYVAEFEEFRNMFYIVGGALSFIVGLVGVLNFGNAVLTGILARKRELAVLQSVGMTGKQLKTMLVCEGLYYTLLALLASLVMTVCLGPFLGDTVNSLFWFFSYHLTVLPIVIMLPFFLLLGAAVPLLTCQAISKHTIVERLREAEA